MSHDNASSASQKNQDKSVVMAEYNALRSEILKRIEFRYQLVNLTLIVAGTSLTVGLQPTMSPYILLVYPILALFLTAGWAHNGYAIKRISRYINEHLQAKYNDFEWEEFARDHTSRSKHFGLFGNVSTSGLILTTQLLSVGLALTKFNFKVTEIVLLVCSSVATILTIILLRSASRIWRT